MKKVWIALFLFSFVQLTAFSQRVEDFELKDAVSEKMFRLSEHSLDKAVVLIFTSLNCPFSKLYEDRIMALHQEFGEDGFMFAMVNPHSSIEAEEGAGYMKARASEKGFKFPFLEDPEQLVTRQFEVTKLPEVVVITPSPTGYSIAYRGAIDNNPQLASSANLKYLESALHAIQARRNPSPSSSRPVGCNVRLR